MSTPLQLSADAAPGRSHLPALDGLRGLAVALVMVTHLPADAFAQIHRGVPPLMQMGGYLGVDMFFVLSGFLITRILLDDRSKGIPLRFFLIRRCLRIFPLYYAVLLLHALVAPGIALVWCATYLSNYYFAFVANESLLRHTWSLCVEEHFYMFWPLVAHRLSVGRSHQILKVLMILSLASSCVLVMARAPHAATLIYGGTLSRVWSLALGGLVAYTRFGSGERPSLKLSLLPLSVGCAFALGAVALGSLGRTAPAYLAMVPGYSLVSLSALLVALATAQGQTVLGAVLTARPLRFVGRISYGLYLFHPFVYHFFMARHGERLSAGFVGRATLAVLTAVGVATLSYTYFESYFLRMKSRFGTAKAEFLKNNAPGTQSA